MTCGGDHERAQRCTEPGETIDRTTLRKLTVEVREEPLGAVGHGGTKALALRADRIAVRPGVERHATRVHEHQLSDALAIGAINAAAAMLGTTAEVIATKLGISVADLRVALTSTTTR